MRAGCIFCRIVKGEAAATIVAQSDDWIAIRDIDPKAPTHILVLPRRHIASVNELQDGDAELVGRMVLGAKQVAAQEKLTSGYRLVLNTGRDGGQSVDHIHLHVLGGRPLHWPPG